MPKCLCSVCVKYILHRREYHREVFVDCKCMKIIGLLDDAKYLQWHRNYTPSPGHLALGDWAKDSYIWLHYVESADGLLADDDVLMSTNTRYWSIHDVQRYFSGDLHCEKVLFTYQYPSLRMPTRLGSYFWRANTAMKLPSCVYLKEFHKSLEITLKKMEAKQTQMDRLIVSDQLIKLDRLDDFKRKTFFRILNNVLSFQDRLQLLSLENMQCKRLEGVRLIQQLACFNAETLKYLFLWRCFLPNENPILVNYSYLSGSGQHIPRPETKHCFLRSLAELKNLRILALEYAHIADGSGYALMTLMPVLKRPHFRLQLICRDGQTPDRNDTALGVGGYDIPDTAWRRVSVACPDLYLLIAFYQIRDYDNMRRYLSPSIPLKEIHLQYGIDLLMQPRQDSDVSCFFRHISFYFANSLATVSIHQWRFATYPLRRVFEIMPHLVRFFYIGRVQDEEDLRSMLYVVSYGVCDKLKQIKIQIQDEETKRDYWKKVIENTTEEFNNIMKLYEVNLSINVYKS